MDPIVFSEPVSVAGMQDQARLIVTKAGLDMAAAAHWNAGANVPWDEFFVGANADKKDFYLRAMRAALMNLGLDVEN